MLRKGNLLLSAFCVVLVWVMPGCKFFKKKPTRETIFDRVVNIPKTLDLDVPKLPPLCDSIAGLKKGYIDVGNGKLYYEEEGHGIPIVLINGGPGGTHHVFRPHFSQIKDIARLIYYDQRGTGKSSQEDTGKTYTIKQAAEDLENLRKALKIDKWVVLGWSYGGLLAQSYALTYPQNCTGLVLVTSSSGLPNVEMMPSRQGMFLSKAEKEAISKIWPKLDKGQITKVQALYNRQLRGDWKRQNYYKPTQEQMVRKARYEWSPAPGFRDVIDWDISQINLEEKFDDFEIPTLIVESKWDLTWSEKKAELLHKNHPNAQFKMFEKSGHGVFSDEPKKFFGLLRAFLMKSSSKQVKAKPGNRISWPKPLSEMNLRLVMANALELNKDGKNKLFLQIYKQALSENVDDRDVWKRLITYFVNSESNYEECLMALQKFDAYIKRKDPESWKKIEYVVKAWQGHMLDLLGKRGEALKLYQEALKTSNGKRDNVFDVDLFIDKQWLKNRLKTPFKW